MPGQKLHTYSSMCTHAHALQRPMRNRIAHARPGCLSSAVRSNESTLYSLRYASASKNIFAALQPIMQLHCRQGWRRRSSHGRKGRGAGALCCVQAPCSSKPQKTCVLAPKPAPLSAMRGVQRAPHRQAAANSVITHFRSISSAPGSLRTPPSWARSCPIAASSAGSTAAMRLRPSKGGRPLLQQILKQIPFTKITLSVIAKYCFLRYFI